MIKEVLKEKEPIAYKQLKNSLNSGKLAQVYLLYGEHNPLKLDSAFLLAQSIIEGKDDFACEQCDTCLRIKDKKYFDLIYIDGYKQSIKVEMIEDLLHEFSKTALEKANKKIFIISNINNASVKVLNMILKFIEEPTSENVYGIFISDNIDGLLPTIVSRCMKIPFRTKDLNALVNQYIEKGFDYIDAYLLANIKHEFDSEMDLNDESYLFAKDYVYKTIDNLDNKEYIPVLMNQEFYPILKTNKEAFDYYLDIFFQMVEDSLYKNDIQDREYTNLLSVLRKNEPEKLFKILVEEKDRCFPSTNKSLLLDQLVAKMILY